MTRTASRCPRACVSISRTASSAPAGFDGCVSVWSPGGWDAYVNAQSDRLDGFSREGRLMQRYLFGGALPRRARPAGPRRAAGAAAAARAAEQGHRHRRSARPARDLGPRSLAPPARRGRRERRECCRTSCPVQALTRTSRCWRARSARCSTCTRASSSSTAPSVPAATRACSPAISTAAASSSPSTATRRTQPYVDALRATVGTGVQIRPMHGPFATCLRRLLDEDAAGRRRPDGSRHVVDAGRRSPSAASATRTTRRSTCAWIRATS